MPVHQKWFHSLALAEKVNFQAVSHYRSSNKRRNGIGVYVKLRSHSPCWVYNIWGNATRGWETLLLWWVVCTEFKVQLWAQKNNYPCIATPSLLHSLSLGAHWITHDILFLTPEGTLQLCDCSWEVSSLGCFQQHSHVCLLHTHCRVNILAFYMMTLSDHPQSAHGMENWGEEDSTGAAA